MRPNANTEINTASFINEEMVLLGCFGDSEPFDEENTDELSNGQYAIWSFKENVFSKILKPEAKLGNIFVINEHYAWDLYRYPKIVNIQTGEVMSEIEDVDSGLQSSSIIHYIKDLPQVAISRDRKNIAIKKGNTIEIITFVGLN